MKNIVVGIDPGMSGSVAVLDNGIPSIYDTPIFKVKKGKYDYDIAEMVKILSKFKKSTCIIENIFSMRGQGVSSTFNFGRGKGLWEGIAHSMQMKVHMVTPAVWKKTFPTLLAKHVNKPILDQSTEDNKALLKQYNKERQLAKHDAKGEARILAQKLYPNIAHMFDRVKDDGRAEALLIAHYGFSAMSSLH